MGVVSEMLDLLRVFSAKVPMALTSPPAQKNLPLAVSTTARTVWSAWIPLVMPASSAAMASLMQLAACGRLSSMTAILSSRATLIVSYRFVVLRPAFLSDRGLIRPWSPPQAYHPANCQSVA